jgi:hypothetical protein
MRLHMMKYVLFFLAFGLTNSVRAQSADTGGPDHQLILQLISRIQDLEAEVKALKEVSPGPVSTGKSVPPQLAPTTASPASPAAIQAGTVAGVTHDMTIPGLENLHIQGFSDIQYHASGMPGDHNSFGLGQFNLFITNRLSNKLSVLGEVIIEADTTNAVGVDLERLLFQYSANDYFNLSVGRYHTDIGFYNTAYHHSTWLQTTVDRPFLFAFEDGGGVLPIHNVGVSATGRIPSGELGLHYVAELGNGRASRSPFDEAVQNRVDENNGKAVNFGLYARPGRLPGFQAGFSIYHDSLHPAGLSTIRQTIFSGHSIYQNAGLEFMNEVVVLHHTMENGLASHIPAFYSQLSKRFGKFRPYFRYEYVNVPRGELLFGDVGLLHGPIGGVRYDFSEFAAYKVEYFRNFTRSGDWNGLRTQVSFTF